MAWKLIVMITLVTAATAGCLQTTPEPSSQDDQHGESPADDLPTAREEPPIDDDDSQSARPPPPFNFRQVALEGCKSYGTVVDVPHALFPDIVSPAWADRNPIPLSVIVYRIMECERFVWGSFDRAVSLVFEFHSHFSAPPQCDAGTRDEEYVLNRLLVSDAAIADDLRARLGVDVIVGPVEMSAPPVDGHDEHHVAWQGPDGFEASLSFFAEPYDAGHHPITMRTYSINADSVVAIDWEHRLISPPEEIPLSAGEYGDGTLMAQVAPQDALVLADVWYDHSAIGNVEVYGGLTCE